MSDKNKYKKIINNLKDIHEKIGLSCDVDTVEFLKEMSHCYNNADSTTGYTTNNKKIETDYGYVTDFFKSVEDELKKQNNTGNKDA